jgi:hypothetical protein
VLAVEVYQLLIELSGWTPQQYEMSVAVVIDWLLDQQPQQGAKGGGAWRRPNGTASRPDLPDGGDRPRAGGGGVAGGRRPHPDGEWSHECHQVAWRQGATQAAPGVRFRGRNRSGWVRWSRVCEVIAVDAPREIAWRPIPTMAFPDSTEWRITLEPVDTRPRILRSYQVTRCPGWYEWVVARVSPARSDRSGALADDLRRIGVIADGDAHDVEPLG